MQAEVSVKQKEIIPKRKKKKLTLKMVYQQRYLLLMSVPFMIWLFIFSYIPLWGWTMAFQEYMPGIPFNQQQWVGLQQFQDFLHDPAFFNVLRNTLAMSVMGLVAGMTIPVLFAIFLNEIAHIRYKKVIQTVSYLPHFIGWVIAASIITNFLSVDGGVINDLLLNLHIIKDPIEFMAKPTWFWWILTFSNVWKETGWNAIIFIAAIVGIDQSLYEAAEVDGAGRLSKILHITLPGIKPTFVIILIMSIGNLINIGFEAQYQLQNNLVLDYSQVIDTYVLTYGISQGRYSFGTAVGMFKSIISVILLLAANTITRKFGEESISII